MGGYTESLRSSQFRIKRYQDFLKQQFSDLAVLMILPLHFADSQTALPRLFLCLFKASNELFGIYASPRTSIETSHLSRSGIERIVFRLAVISSPIVPSPRVAP